MKTVVLSVAAFSLVASSFADVPPCAPHGDTGLPVPDRRAPLCVRDEDPAGPLVVATTGGILLIEPEPGASGGCTPVGDGSCVLYRSDASVLLRYCPDLPGPAPRHHDAECLSELATREATQAFHGRGRLTASAVLRGSGVVDCPASVYLDGEISTRDGIRFRLDGGIVLASARSETIATDAVCRAVHDDLRLALAAPVPGLPAAVAKDGAALGDLRALERLAELDPERALLVDSLARLDEARFRLLERLLEADAAGTRAILEGPTVGASTQATDGDILNIDVVDQISALIDDLSSSLSSLSSRVPSFPELRETFRQVSVDDLVRLLDFVREQVGSFLDLIVRLREGYDAWVGNGCDAASACHQFRGELRALLADLREGARFAQVVACAEAPGLPIRTLETGLVEQLVVDGSPPIVLYGLARVLDAVTPADARSGEAGWLGLIRQALDALPVDLVHDLDAICRNETATLRNTEARMVSRSIESTGPVLCAILRPPEVDVALKTAQGIGTFAHIATTVINHFTADTKDATVGAVVGGGAAAGTSVKNPLNVITRLLKQIADKFGKPDESVFNKLMEKRDQCLEADHDIEEALIDCKPPLSALLQLGPAFLAPRPTLAEVKGLVQRGIGRVNECKFFGGCAELDTVAAQAALDEAEVHGPLAAFPRLCEAYCELRGGERCDLQTGPEPGEGQGGGQGHGPGGNHDDPGTLRR